MSATTEQPSLFGSAPAVAPSRPARPARAKAPRKPALAPAAVPAPVPVQTPPEAGESFEAWFAANRDPDSRVAGYEHAMFMCWSAQRLLAALRAPAPAEEARDAA